MSHVLPLRHYNTTVGVIYREVMGDKRTTAKVMRGLFLTLTDPHCTSTVRMYSR